jgi:hypothetical protein
MSAEPIIPYGYKRITGQAIRGDGIWNGERFVKVKKEYPHSEGRPGFNFIIRRCTVTQEHLLCVEPGAMREPEPTVMVTDSNGRNPRNLNRAEYDALVASGMMWEFHPDAPHQWPHSK